MEGEKLLLTSFFEKTSPLGIQCKDKCVLHLQEQAARQGDVVMLHSQVQCCSPRLLLLSIDVCSSGHQQQQTRQAVAHHGYVNGIQT